MDGQRRELRAGDSIVIPPNTPHRFWNESGAEARSRQFFHPALDIASFFETFFALAAQGKLGRTGMPSMLQLAVMVPEFSDEIRTVSPPWAVTRTVTTLLRPIARARGYRERLEFSA